MKILVTGYRGYIGSHLVWWLRQRHGSTITIDGFDSAAPYDRPGSFGIDRLMNRRFSLLTVGELHFKDIEPYDVIFHLAAESNVAIFNERPYESVFSTINVMDMLKIPHKKFVFASSAAVFPNESLYGRTKFLCEKMIEKMSSDYVILRLHNVAGAIPESGFYEFHQPETHLIPNLILNDTITVFGDGDQERDYVHVEDVCKAFFYTAIQHPQYYQNRITEFGTTRGRSVIEVIRLYQEVSGKRVNVILGDKREGDVKSLVASNTLFETIPLRKTIMDAISAYEKAGLLTI